MLRPTRPNHSLVFTLALGFAVSLSACSGNSNVDTTAATEASAVDSTNPASVESSSAATTESSVAPVESVVPIETVASAPETTSPPTAATPSTTAAASTQRMTVAEAQAIVDRLTQTIGDAYALAKRGELAAARAKLAEAETGDQLAIGLTVFDEGADLSEVAQTPGRPIYRVVRVSDSKGVCTSLAGEYDVSPLFGGSNEFIPTAMFLTNEGGQWKLSFFTESETSSDYLC